ncbi:MAG: hypothetical protein AB7F20_13560 [Geoalkalibacter sp.]|uniref:hypothetical protein n=1 Tax=Geoalkalibacter sp. TaxID=3041440 RepID=UPI003D0CA60D
MAALTALDDQIPYIARPGKGNQEKQERNESKARTPSNQTKQLEILKHEILLQKHSLPKQ